MLLKEQLQELLDICVKHGGDFAEIFDEESQDEVINTIDLDVQKINTSLSSGIGIRIYKDFQSVYAYTQDKDMDNLRKMADDLALSINGEQVIEAKPLVKIEYENRHPILKDPFASPKATKIAIMKEAIAPALSYDKRISKVTCTLMSMKQHVSIANSDGKWIEDTRIRVRLALNSFASENDQMQIGSKNHGASCGLELYDNYDLKEMGVSASKVAIDMLSAIDCPSGQMPVIIENAFGGVIFHEACGHSLEATGVAKNQSVFAGKLGEKIAADCVSAVDDGTIVNAWGSSNIDDEGNFTKRNVLIENGILKGYMIDQLNGRRMGMDSTGSARREDYHYQPTSRMTNTFILPGHDSLEDMLADIKLGLYAKSMGGGSVNPYTGEFNFAVNEGYLIEDGKITKLVKGASLIGNGKDILMNIDKVGDNLERANGMCGSISGSVCADVGQPRLRVKNIIVGGSK